MEFDWDDAKAASNEVKHGVSFEQAQALLESETDHLEIFDAEHSDEEDRFISIGPIDDGVILVVWTERDEDVIRIISARWATTRERQKYMDHMEQRT
ncbi:MAG: BrnT family toxin [Myxococcales bacterium]|nr:BrnT family toxin [Myxococcales bacterium]